MGTKDTITKDYMADTRIFADVFNHMLYKGENIIDPDSLQPLDTTAITVPYGSGKSEVPVQKFRDEFKALTAMHDKNSIYLLLGIENQSEQHFAMPVRNMVYDSLEYAGQVERSSRSHRRSGQRPPTSAEYLSGFYHSDRLIPVITVVVYFGTDTWTAPRSLHEMFSVQDPAILSLIPDYRINLFSPAEIKDEELNKLRSSLREVMLFIKYAKDKRKLQELTSSDSSFHSLERKAARVINSVTGLNLSLPETERRIDMCQAVKEMCDDARAEGRTQGLSEGQTLGLQQQALRTAQKMLQDPRFSLEDISNFSGLPIEEVRKLQAN